MEQDDQFLTKKRKGGVLESESKQPKTVLSQPKSGKNVVTNLFDFYKNNAKNTTPQTTLTPSIIYKSRTQECFYPELYKLLPQKDNAGRVIRYHAVEPQKGTPLIGSSTELFEVGAVGKGHEYEIQQNMERTNKALKSKREQCTHFYDIVLNKKRSAFLTAQQRLFHAIEKNDLQEVKRLCTPYNNSMGRLKRRLNLEQCFPIIDPNNLGLMSGHTPLTFAVQNNQDNCDTKKDSQIIKYLIEECKVNVNKINAHGVSSLYCAWHIDDWDMVDYLVNRGADINEKDDKGNSLLHEEVKKVESNINWFKFCLQKNSIDILSTNKKGKTAWMLAAEKGKKDIIKFITNHVIQQMKNNKQEEARLCVFCKTDMKDVEELALTDYGCLTLLCKGCKDTLKQHNPKCPKCRRDMH
jgi:hypothetical protein